MTVMKPPGGAGANRFARTLVDARFVGGQCQLTIGVRGVGGSFIFHAGTVPTAGAPQYAFNRPMKVCGSRARSRKP